MTPFGNNDVLKGAICLLSDCYCNFPKGSYLNIISFMLIFHQILYVFLYYILTINCFHTLGEREASSL